MSNSTKCATTGDAENPLPGLKSVQRHQGEAVVLAVLSVQAKRLHN
jgi:hypothetical protein